MGSEVPCKLQVRNGIFDSDVKTSSMIPLEFEGDGVSSKSDVSVTEVIRSHMGFHGSIGFVVRRPG